MENQNLDNSNWDENQKLGNTTGNDSGAEATDGALSQGNYQNDDELNDLEYQTEAGTDTFGEDEESEGEIEASDADTDDLLDDEDTEDLDEQIEGSDADEDQSVGSASSLDEGSVTDEDDESNQSSTF